jgi:hypothetical protein
MNKAHIYPWTRYWVPRDSGCSPDGAYLADPESEYAWADARRAVSLAELRDKPVLVLLGEAGMGKSRALQQAFEALQEVQPEDAHSLILNLNCYGAGNQAQLAAELFESTEFAAYRDGARLIVFLDSLDEGRNHMPGLDAWLANQLRKKVTDPARFQLRIASRTAGWSASLEAAVGEIWRNQHEGPAIFEICPLRRTDVVQAANIEGFPADDLLEAVRNKEIDALASRPVTLDFLFAQWRKQSTLPNSKATLYEDGILALCEENNPDRVNQDRLCGFKQRMVVAGRVACALQLCDHSALWLGLDRNRPDGDVALADLTGKERDGDFTVSEPVLRETLNTAGLFTGVGQDRMGFAHQSFAEFLTAWTLSRTGNPPEQMLRPLRFEAGGRVVPKLWETAAWLASLSRPVLDLLLREEPALLLHVDGAALTETDRACLVQALLEAVAAQTLFAHDLPQRALRKLVHAGLAEQLRPWITERSGPRYGRDFAMDLARWCEVRELATELACSALAHEEDYILRITAAHAVVRIKDETALAALKPLALGQAGPDPERRLKNLALHALWPKHLTADEFFKEPIDANGLYSSGALDDEIYNGAFFETLLPEHMPAALEWVRRSVETQPSTNMIRDRLAYGVLLKAWQLLDEPGVLEDFSATTLSLLSKFSSPFRKFDGRWNTDDPLRDDDKRHRLLSSLLDLISPDGVVSMVYSDTPFARAENLPWLLDRLDAGLLNHSHRNAASLISLLLRRHRISTTIINRVLDRCGVCAPKPDLILRKENAWLTHPMRLKARHVQQARNNWWKEAKEFRRKQEQPVLLDPPPGERVLNALAIIEEGNLSAWPALASELTLGPSSTQFGWPVHLQALPGWLEATPEVQLRIQSVALGFLRHEIPDTNKLFASNTYSNVDIAGLSALELLYYTAPTLLDALTPEHWAKWAPLIVAGYHDDSNWQREMRQVAHHHAPEAVLQAMLNQVDKQDRGEHGLNSLHDFVGFWSRALVEGLLVRLDKPEYKPKSRRTILEQLLRQGEPVGRQRALVLLAQTADGELRGDAAALLLAWDSAASWPLISRLLEDEPEFARGFMGKVAHDMRWPGGDSPSLDLEEEQTADLFLWLETQFPAAQYQEHQGGFTPETNTQIADLRRRLLEHLQTIGTWAAVHALERIAHQLPDRDWMKRVCQRARAQAMNNQWQAPSWEELTQLLADPNCRLIHTDADLTLVVLESLARLQQKLRGETPLAPFLWDENSEEDPRKPKGEGRLSEFVKDHLSSDLNRRGVLINREVEIKNWPGKGRGESLDLLIQAATPKDGPVATVVVEVKGCWNAGLDTAMETQLRDQYLTDTRYRHGIYLVGWYGPPEKRKSCNKSLDNLRSQLDEQAQQLSKNSLHIHAVTLDLSYPSKPHPDTAPI